jgi:formate-dependent nitrite reductase membrane component NrfD
MNLPSTGMLFAALNASYAVGLVLLILLGSVFVDYRDAIVTVGPIFLTVTLFFGQMFVTRREERAIAAGRQSGAKADHVWGGILLLYIIIALLYVGLNGSLGLT